MIKKVRPNLVSDTQTTNGIGDIFPHSPTIYASQSSATKYLVNITDDFDAPSTFDQVVAVLANATEDDEIVFNINSVGGYVSSLNMLLGWKAVCPARQVHVLMGDACSAASAFFLSKADQYIIGEGASMMIHEYQSGGYGTSSNNDRRHRHSREQCEKFVRLTYANFLSEEEILEVLKGVEVYLHADEIRERMVNRSKVLNVSGAARPASDSDIETFKSYISTLSLTELQAEFDEIEMFKGLILKRIKEEFAPSLESDKTE